MKLFTLIALILVSGTNLMFNSSSIECEICGEYKGGRAFYSWVTLILKPNGNYEFSESRHTMQSINDKGRWTLENDILTLNSDSKSRWESSRKSKKKYFFNNQKCDVEGNSILIRKEKNKGFNLVYYTLTRKERK